MREVVCTGIALQSALGNLDLTWQRLLQGHTGIGVRQIFPDLPAFPVACIGLVPQDLRQLTLNLVADLLIDAGWQVPMPDCPVVVGSSRAYQPYWEKLAKTGANYRILDYLPHMPAIEIARLIGSNGAILAPMAACATGIWSIERGYQMILAGADLAVVGAVEAPLSPLTVVGFQQMGAMAATGCYPFDRQREGLVLGEGGALLALEERENAVARGAQIYGRILGCGLTNDASHAWGVGGGAGHVAIQDCLVRNGLTALQIDHINLHGTSTQVNDCYEASLVNQFFPRVPVTANKGALGHTLGASAALSVALALRSLREQILLPTVGCADLEFDISLVHQPTKADLKNVMCWSFGFGGQNAVLALGAWN